MNPSIQVEAESTKDAEELLVFIEKLERYVVNYEKQYQDTLWTNYKILESTVNTVHAE